MASITPILNATFQMPFYADDNANGSFHLPAGSDTGLFKVCSSDTASEFTPVYSRGWLSHDKDPLDVQFTMILFQIPLVLVVSQLVYLLLRPLKQPRIVCDILGGIIFGPTALGAIPYFRYYIFPPISILPTRILAAYGLMYHLFLMGVKMDPGMVRKSGRKALWVGISSVVAPLIATIASSLLLRDYVIASIARRGYLIFLAAFASVTAFPVLGELLAELRILNTELGRLGMSAAMINCVVGWFFMVFFVIMSQLEVGWNSVWLSQLSLMALVVFIVLVIKPCMNRMVRRTPKGTPVSEEYLVAILGGVLVIGLVGEAIGISPMNGALIVGLIIPEGPPLGTALVQKVELLANEVMMPLFFFAMGNMVRIPPLPVLEMWLPLAAIILTGIVAKVMGTTLPAFLCNIPLRNATILGLMMNFRGVVEIIVLFHLRLGRLLDDEGFSVLVMLVVLCTAITSPLVSILYDPLNSTLRAGGRRTIQHLKAHSEFPIVACMHDDNPVPAMIRILEASSAADESHVALYALHVADLQGRANSAVISHKDPSGFINQAGRMDRLLNAFLNYELEKKGRVSVMPYTIVAPFVSMHHDICSIALNKMAVFILLPYTRNDAATNSADHAMRGILREILTLAPCSIGILVCNAISCSILSSVSNFQYHIGVLFWGGPDDREALSLASRMARHPGVTLRVTRFVKTACTLDIDNKELQMDGMLVEDFMITNARSVHVMSTDILVKDAEDMFSMIRSLDVNFDLLIVGRRQGSDTSLSQELEELSEAPELGLVGDMLTTPEFKSSAAVLVVQQYGT